MTKWLPVAVAAFIFLSAPSRAGTVKVGLYENKPKVFTDDKGKASGIFIDILRHIAEKEKWDLEFVPGTWSEGLKRLEAGEIDLMPDVAYSDKRSKRFDFNKVPVLSSWFHVYCHQDDDFTSVLDLSGKKVAVLKGSIQQDVFTVMSSGFGLESEIVMVDDYKASLEILDAKKVDAVILNRFYGREHSAAYKVKETSIMFHPSRLHFAAPKGRGEYFEAIDKHLTEMKTDADSVYFDVLRHWLKSDSPAPYHKWLVYAALGLVALSVLALSGNFLLKWQVKKRTDELRRSERNYREVFNGTNEAIIIHDAESGEIMDVNQTMLDRFGYTSREEVLRLSVSDISANRAPFTEREARRWMQMAAQEGTQLVEWRCRRADGSEFDAEVGLTRTEIGGQGRVLAAVRDVTQRREAEKALRRSEERFRKLYGKAPVMAVALDNDGIIKEISSYWCEVLGYEIDEVMGKSGLKFFAEESRDSMNGKRIAIWEGEAGPELVKNVQRQMIRKDGSPIDVLLTYLPEMDDEGKTTGMLCIAVDITEEKQMRAQLQHQDKIAATGILAAGVAHEIGNPLLAISMAAQSLHRKSEDPYVRNKLDLISGHIDRISKIVQQMSDLARPPTSEKRRFDVNGVIERAIDIVRYDKRAKQAEIEVQLASDLPPITGVEDHLIQVFINLALNAADALQSVDDSHPKRLAVTSEVVGEGGGRKVRIVFEDSGKGIPDEDLKKVFQPFFTTKDVGKGTGLGLAVSYRIIQEHGGDILVESSLDEGTRFLIELPVSV
jgi:PAS domain S-box-containing protein